jgi:hypothetical protein
MVVSLAPFQAGKLRARKAVMIQQSIYQKKSNTSVVSSKSLSFRIVFFAALLLALGVFPTVKTRAQEKAPAQSTAAKPAPKKRYTLRVTKGDITGVSLKADKAKMSEIAAELAKDLGTKVILGPTMTKEAITVEFQDVSLEPALRLLAPRVYVDYEIRANTQPALMGIFLMGQNDPAPDKNAVVQGSSEAMMIEGNTEDTPEQADAAESNDPLQVDLDDDYLTIKSKKQPLQAVVLTIAEVLGVPAEIKYDSTEIVDTEIKDTMFWDAIARLSPNVRLYLRADLTKSQRTPLRITLVPPVTKLAGQ